MAQLASLPSSSSGSLGSASTRSSSRSARLLTLGATVIVLALLALFVWGMGRRGATLGTVPTPLRQAPLFELTLFDRSQFSLVHMRGTPVLVNFWASWCIPCEDEAPALEAAWNRYRDRVQFLGIDVQDSDTEALRFLRTFGVSYPNGRDVSGSISVDYGMSGVPETYFIRSDGTIQRKWAGPLNASQIESFLTEILAP